MERDAKLLGAFFGAVFRAPLTPNVRFLGEIMAKKTTATSNDDTSNVGECFIIMPIANCDGYDDGHFNRVYEDIFKPACRDAKYKPVRADEIKQTNLIHLDILQRLIDSPMAICDLSSRNPNVLFELGLRQAFDKPTVLVQEVGTKQIFDIAPLRYTEYRKELKYREVLEDQATISEAIIATKEAADRGEGVNSIVSILSLAGPATLKEPSEHDSSKLLQLVRAEMSEMRSDFRRTIKGIEDDRYSPRVSPRMDYPRRMREAHMLVEEVNMMSKGGVPEEVVLDYINKVQEKLIRILQSDPPVRYEEEAKMLYRQIEAIEQETICGKE